MTDSELEGWYRDPFGLHDLRFYHAGRPTRLVRDGAHEFYEEPARRAASQPRQPDSGPNWGGWSPAGPGGGGGPGAYETGPGGPVEYRLSHERSHRRGDGGPRRSAKKRIVAPAVVAVAVAVALIALVGLRGNGSNPSLTPTAFVSRAATQTMAQKTADVTLSGTIQASGKTAAVQGTGQLDLTGKQVSLDLSASVPGGGAFEMHEIVSGGTVYLQFVVEGRNLFQAATGKPWLAIPIGQALQSGSTSADSNPASSLAILQQKGAKVTPLSSRSINGQSCNGYQVTPTRQAMIANAEQEWAKAGLSEAQTSSALQELQKVTPPTITVWFDAQQQLACQMTFDLQTGGLTSGSTSAHMTMTFTNYGAPVHISPPPASDTAGPQQLPPSGH